MTQILTIEEVHRDHILDMRIDIKFLLESDKLCF